tara:strand:- start:76709 stop:77173 length:465 start_codon:yes stop_codon:yes gene_type:complete
MPKNISEILFLTLAVVIAGLALAGVADMPPAFYDPLGAGAFPRWIAVIIAVLVALKLITTTVIARADIDRLVPLLPPRFHWRMAAMFALICAYVIALWAEMPGFRITTAIFLSAGMLLLTTQRNPRLIVAILGACALSAVGLDYIFRTVFFLNL